MIGIETYYLIDYENVHGDGLLGCQDLGKTDHIVIFFTQNAKNIDMSDISDHGSAALEMIEVPAGKQSTDMHIGSYLGYLAGKNGKNCTVVIVSKDTDFDNVIKFWKQKTEIAASRAQQIKKKPTVKQQTAIKQAITAKKNSAEISDEKKERNREVRQAVRAAGYEASVANTVAQIAVGSYGDDHMLSKVRNALKERYTDHLGVYRAVRPVLSKYAGEEQSKGRSQEAVPQNKTAVNSEVQKILSKGGFSNEIINNVASMAVKNLGVKNGKQQTYRSIISRHGQSKGLTIYNQIKKLI